MKGFTLIEGIIVLAIVGIIVAIAVPAYQRAKDGKPMFENTGTHLTPTGMADEFQLKDGTRCVKTSREVTCDWRR